MTSPDGRSRVRRPPPKRAALPGRLTSGPSGPNRGRLRAVDLAPNRAAASDVRPGGEGNGPLVLTYLLAVLAACANANSSVLLRKANRDLPMEDSLSWRLVPQLLHRPVWFVGMLSIIVGFVLQASALAGGELAVVEPILVFELPATLLLASVVFHSALRGREWTSTAGMTFGLAALLYFLSPSPGSSTPPPWYVWVTGIGLNLVVVAAAVEWGRRGLPWRPSTPSSGRRGSAYGVAAGCQFGLTAALMKGAMSRYEQGFAAIFTSWHLYAMMAAGILGMFLLQSAMRAGVLLAAQPGLTLSDPLLSVLWGVFAFQEQVRGDGYLILALAGAVIIAVSVLVLARSPLLSDGGGAADGDVRRRQPQDTSGPERS